MNYTLVDVIEVKVLKDYQLHLKFENGVEGDIDVAELVPFEGVFAPLKDKNFFARVRINPEIGTICWENGADISPAVLYENIKNEPFKYADRFQKDFEESMRKRELLKEIQILEILQNPKEPTKWFIWLRKDSQKFRLIVDIDTIDDKYENDDIEPYIKAQLIELEKLVKRQK